MSPTTSIYEDLASRVAKRRKLRLFVKTKDPHTSLPKSGFTMPSKLPLRIVIGGGNADSMSTATRACRLDEHSSIRVLEKGSYVSFANCGMPYFLGEVIQDDVAVVKQTPKALHDRFDIEFSVNTKA